MKKTDSIPIQIPRASLETWQEIVNIMADIMEIPAGLIMRLRAVTRSDALKAAGAALILLLGFACTEPDGGDEKAGAPDELSISTLQSAPDTLIIGEKRLILTTCMWRDFMPVSPPDGKPLIAIFTVMTVDSTDLPFGLQADAAWVVCEGEIWSTWIDEEAPPPEDEDPFRLVRIARNGPKFGPDVLVTAVVRLTDGLSTVYLLRADNQYIYRTD